MRLLRPHRRHEHRLDHRGRSGDRPRRGAKIGLGADWSPSGSKNLLAELKVAWLYSQEFLDGLFTARDLVAMATRTAAQILKWERALGSIEAGKRADLLVIDGTDGDPYELLVRARETSVRLVLINGVARYGRRELMDPLGTADQTVRVEGDVRQLFLAQEAVPGEVAAVQLATATSALTGALRDIRKLARELERRPDTRAPRRAFPPTLASRSSGRWPSTRPATPGSSCGPGCPTRARATSRAPSPSRAAPREPRPPQGSPTS